MTAVVIPLFPPPAPAIDGQLALPLSWEVRPGVPAIPEVPRHLRLVTPEPHPVADLNAPTPAWVARMARAVSEVGSGTRPAGQLTRWVQRDELARLAARGTNVSRHPAGRLQRVGHGAAEAMRQVRAVRICPVAPGVAETSAVLVGHGRGQAIAMRFEHLADRWVVTALSLG